MPKKKSDDIKVRKNRWIQIISPNFNDQIIGETTVYDPKLALNKMIRANLMHLTGDPRKQNIDILFQNEKMKGETGVLAKIVGYQIQQPALRKLVRRGKTKIQDSFKCMTGDNVPVIIKTFIITRFNVNRQIASKIRTGVKQNVVNKVSEMTFENIIQEVIYSKLQKELKSVAEKVYPVRLVEFSAIKIMHSKKGVFEKPVKDAKKAKDDSQEIKEETDNKEETKKAKGEKAEEISEDNITKGDEVQEEETK